MQRERAFLRSAPHTGKKAMEVQTGAPSAPVAPESKEEMHSRMKQILDDMRKSLTTPASPRLTVVPIKPGFLDPTPIQE
jgi:hypothetical protein